LDKIKDLIQPWDAPEIWPIRCKRLARYLGVRAPFRSGAQNVGFRCAFKEKGSRDRFRDGKQLGCARCAEPAREH
jgi:hypothetical protein